MPGITKMEVDSKGKLEKGSEIKTFTRGKEIKSSITDYKNHSYVTIASTQGNFRADYTYTFAKIDEFTKVSLIAKIEVRGFIKLFLPITKQAIKKQIVGN